MQEKRREAQEERLKERLAMAETRDSLANRRAVLGAAAERVDPRGHPVEGLADNNTEPNTQRRQSLRPRRQRGVGKGGILHRLDEGIQGPGRHRALRKELDR